MISVLSNVDKTDVQNTQAPTVLSFSDKAVSFLPCFINGRTPTVLSNVDKTGSHNTQAPIGINDVSFIKC